MTYSKTLFFTLFLFIFSIVANAETKDILIVDGELVITKSDAQLIIQDMSTEQKTKILSDKNKLKNLLLDLMITRKQAQVARQKGLDKDTLISWKIKNNTNQFLARTLATDYSKNITIPNEIELLARDYYDSHPEKYMNKEKVKASHILISTMDKSNIEKATALKKAEQLLKDLRNDLDFKKAAREHSEDPGSAQKGGELGYFSHGAMVKPFENAAFSLKNNNDLSEIIESQFGYHIIKLLDHKAASITPYEIAKKSLIAEQAKKYRQKKTGDYINSFGITKDTVIYAPALEDFYKQQIN